MELSDVVRTYLENRFDMRAPELTTEEFLESVSDSPDLTRDHQTLLRQFLRQADLVGGLLNGTERHGPVEGLDLGKRQSSHLNFLYEIQRKSNSTKISK